MNKEKLNKSKFKYIWEKDKEGFLELFKKHVLNLFNEKNKTRYSVLNFSNKRFMDIASKTKIIIEDFKFDDFDDEFMEVCNTFKSVNFRNCLFNSKEITLEKVHSFNRCQFISPKNKIFIYIIGIESKDEHCIFTYCTFEACLELNPLAKITKIIEEINVNLFFNCDLESLTAKYVSFKNHIFLNKMRLFENGYSKVHNQIVLENCTFDKEFKIMNCKELNNLSFNNSVFNSKCKIVECEIENVYFQQTKFSELVGFDSSIFGKTNFRNTRFNKLARFNKTKFLKNVNFDYTYFNEESIFTNSIFYEKLNLKKAFFLNSGRFLNINEEEKFNETIQIKKYKINLENRETARIIKDSFEQQNNFIEANKFYVLEMKEREKELNVDRKNGKNLYEWLVFKVHQISSNHSQDWALSLFWIFIVGFLTSLFNFYINNSFSLSSFIGVVILVSYSLWLDYISKKENEIKSIFLLVLFYMIYIYETKDIYLNDFVKVINPFVKFNDLNLLDLLSKVTIAYLIYQLIISIRQNTRRK